MAQGLWWWQEGPGGGTISPEAPGPGAMCSLSASILHLLESFHMCFPGGSYGKVSACNEGDPGSIPGLGRSPGEGNGNPLQYSCLENPMDGGAWWATVNGVAKSQTRLSDFTSPQKPSIYCTIFF